MRGEIGNVYLLWVCEWRDAAYTDQLGIVRGANVVLYQVQVVIERTVKVPGARDPQRSHDGLVAIGDDGLQYTRNATHYDEDTKHRMNWDSIMIPQYLVEWEVKKTKYVVVDGVLALNNYRTYCSLSGTRPKPLNEPTHIVGYCVKHQYYYYLGRQHCPQCWIEQKEQGLR